MGGATSPATAIGEPSTACTLPRSWASSATAASPRQLCHHVEPGEPSTAASSQAPTATSTATTA